MLQRLVGEVGLRLYVGTRCFLTDILGPGSLQDVQIDQQLKIWNLLVACSVAQLPATGAFSASDIQSMSFDSRRLCLNLSAKHVQTVAVMLVPP